MINIGYFQDSLGDPEVLLIDVDATGLREFHDFASALANGRHALLGGDVAFRGLPGMVFGPADQN